MLWRMPFDGNIHRITVAGQSFDCTPNHPILTDRGWHPAHDLKRGDYVIQAISDPLFTVEHDKYNRLVSFSDLFEALAIGTITTPQGEANFYGDLPCNDVDTIPVEFLLDKSFEASASDSFSDFNLSESKCSLPLVPVIHANLTEPPSYRPTIDAESLRERQLAFSRLISTGDLSHRKMLSSIAMTNATASRNFHPDSADLFAQVVSTHAKDGRGLFEHESRRYKFLPFENQVVRKFSSHVFTMQTYSGWYGISPLSIIARNCWPEPILPDY
jgi:intein/homing endonuclease